MDPLTALGLASNVVQFVDFGLKVFSVSAEIAGSASGAAEHNLELENVYTKLQTFTSKLELDLANSEPSSPTDGLPAAVALGNAHIKAIRPHIAAIQQIAADCRAVCGQLLDVVKGLRVDPKASNRRLRSLGAALKTAFRTEKIAGLEARLKRFQELLALHFFPLLNEQQAYMSRVLKSLETQSQSWATEQSTRFEKISSQLEVLLDKIHTLSNKGTPPPNRSIKTNGTISMREPHDKSPHLHLDGVEGLSEILDGLNFAEKDLAVAAKEQELLRSLDFRTRTYRHEGIADAHKATFEWIFSDRNSLHLPDIVPDAVLDPAMNATKTPSKTNFNAWLESGTGIFWITGKPGSGKSTLMKFIADHAKTRHALEKWSGTKKVVIASHYFWNAGTTMQYSMKGLLQELVFDVLCFCPELAHDIFPHRLQKWTTTGSRVDNVWTVDELHQGLKKIASHPALPIRCCFFIDGLDEYVGNKGVRSKNMGAENDKDHSELCGILEELATSNNLKCCVSSRPWNVFEHVFGRRSNSEAMFLRVHDLTHNDISLFARSRLQNNTRWKEMGVDDDQIEELARRITNNAQGVFLWVFLVTKSLREGVIDGDTFDDLQRRIEVIPTELEPYFKHMLDHVAAIHHSYMAQTLQIALNAERPLDLSVYYASEHGIKDTDYAMERTPDFDVWRVNLHPEFYLKCRRRINARCGGLLCFEKHGVEFIHRTVHDFLQDGTMQDYLASKVLPGFQPNLATLRAHVFLFRCVVQTVATAKGGASAEYMKELWKGCLKYASRAMQEDENATTCLLDAVADVPAKEEFAGNDSLLQEAIGHILETSVALTLTAESDTTRRSRSKTLLAKRSTMGIGNAASPGLRHTYLCADLDKYVLAKLQSNLHYFDASNLSPLATVLQSHDEWTQTRADIVLLLLESGCDPNEEVKEYQKSIHPWDTGWAQRNYFRNTQLFSSASLWDTRLYSSTSPWKALLDNSYLATTPIGCSLLVAFLGHGASRARIMTLDQSKICAVVDFLHSNIRGYRRTQLTIRQVINAVDVFLEASPEDTKAQLQDILHNFRLLVELRKLAKPGEELATTKFVDKLILRAVQLCFPADDLSQVVAKKAFRKCVSPRVLKTLKNYVESNAVSVPASLSSLAPDSKRQHFDAECEESGTCAKRPKTESNSQCHGRDPSDPIVID